MFGDLWRLTGPSTPELDWLREMLDGVLPSGVSDIRSMPRGSFPQINMGRTDDALHVYVFAAGLKPDDLELSVQNNVLTVSGTRGEQASGDAQGGGAQDERRPHFRQERFSGHFTRSIALPEGVDTERAEAHSHDGVVEIRLPKSEKMKPQRIEVQAS
ncbi:Hsp20/alpha crystallin family protein [Chromohalobacter canadensis]|uniref:Hsp20/alpha crystallin family protein n=1 Tax=Chromohalobacter canadensis TaxID=141389 RepID=A0ABZ0YE70_9GAMM|nr:Hsp20/alpha crystallin family protein [Chromohalobacter canadensis]MCK0769610.1 Hsp20/alpha crystallin family protein [Chromohalobacter canadensis]WQH10390.1 Hsp20/alpha crystallin family protein [Chromohalobacter canadensis]